MSLQRVDTERIDFKIVPPSEGAEVIPIHAGEGPIPEHLRSREYGFEHDFIGLPLRAINMLSQVRHARNDQQTNLEQSIEEVGMRAFPEIAQFDDEHFLAYARVVMHRFGESPTDDELLAGVSRHTDGYIYVIISGHSRIKAIMHNEAERSKQAWSEGYYTDPLNSLVKMQLQKNLTPDAVMLYQITENLHSRPPAEHIASDVLALYRYMTENGHISSPSELFERFGGKLPESTFATIMNFGQLPYDLQKQAFIDSKFPFVVAARIGELTPHKWALEAFKVARGERQLTAAEQKRVGNIVDGFIRTEFAHMGASIHKNKRFGINLQIKRVEDVKKELMRQLEDEGAALFGTTLEDWEMTPEQLAEAEIRVRREKARIALQELMDRPIEHYDTMVTTYSSVAEVDINPTSVRVRHEKLLEVVRPILGRAGLEAAVTESVDDTNQPLL